MTATVMYKLGQTWKGGKIAEASRQLPHTGHKLAINTFSFVPRN